MTNPDDEIRRHPRTIEQDFEGLFRTMRSKRFRNGEDLATILSVLHNAGYFDYSQNKKQIIITAKPD